jgi:hypothetical protein
MAATAARTDRGHWLFRLTLVLRPVAHGYHKKLCTPPQAA